MKELILARLGDVPQAMARPRAFFDKRTTPELYTNALITLGLVTAAYMLILFFTALANMSQLRQIVTTVQGMLPLAAREGFAGKFDALVPWNRLVYPLGFLLYVPVVGVLRHGAVRMLGDTRRSLADMQSITAYGVIPIVIGAALTGALGNLFPSVPEAGKPMHFGFIGVVTAVTTLSCSVWEIVISVSACRTVYGQNIGRALLTWFLPWVGVFIVVLIVTVAFSLVAAAGP